MLIKYVYLLGAPNLQSTNLILIIRLEKHDNFCVADTYIRKIMNVYPHIEEIVVKFTFSSQIWPMNQNLPCFHLFRYSSFPLRCSSYSFYFLTSPCLGSASFPQKPLVPFLFSLISPSFSGYWLTWWFCLLRRPLRDYISLYDAVS